MRRDAVILFLMAAAVAPACGQKAFPPITPNDRIVVVAPRPDDEVLGAGDTAWHLFSLSNDRGNGHTIGVKPTSAGD